MRRDLTGDVNLSKKGKNSESNVLDLGKLAESSECTQLAK
jgi:hypothetical protein